MKNADIIPHLFRKEYQKIISVLSQVFGLKQIEIAEDIVSDTFLAATESWVINGVPEYPVAWLYTTAKNKAKNYYKHVQIFDQKIVPEIKNGLNVNSDEIDIDLSDRNIKDSQLSMIFAICNPCNPDESQIALALNLLCGFGPNEIAEAYLTNREVIYKRISRAKERLKDNGLSLESPGNPEIKDRLENVLKIVYLLFSEGYYSVSQNTTLRKDFCTEAMRLTLLLINNESTNLPETNALMALMCFHTSRFEARMDDYGETILYQDQNQSLWNSELIGRGIYFLGKAARGKILSKYHLEAGIAYWHTYKEDTAEKWSNILELYNNLTIQEKSPIVALNRCYVLSKVKGKRIAIHEAEKLNLLNNHFYYNLLGNLYTDIDNSVAIENYKIAIQLARTENETIIIKKKMEILTTS